MEAEKSARELEFVSQIKNLDGKKSDLQKRLDKTQRDIKAYIASELDMRAALEKRIDAMMEYNTTLKKSLLKLQDRGNGFQLDLENPKVKLFIGMFKLLSSFLCDSLKVAFG